MDQQQLQAYFQRIGFEAEPQADFTTLAEIQKRHIGTFAFENLNPLLKLGVEIDSLSIYKKMIEQGRGGYCFEQNSLLKEVLETIGFEVRALLGRAGRDAKSSGRTHMVLKVDLDKKSYLVDVGYGGLGPSGPLLMVFDLVQDTPHNEYRLVPYKDQYRLEARLKDEWRRLYEFSLLDQIFADFKVGNWYTSTHADTIFTQTLNLAIRLPEESFTLRENILTTYKREEEPETHTLNSVEEVMAVLENNFKLNLSYLDQDLLVKKIAEVLEKAGQS